MYERSNNRHFWTFEFGIQEGINVPLWVLIFFHQIDRQYSQNLNNDTFYRHPVTTTQWIIGIEKYPDAGILLNYDADDFSQGSGQIKEAFRALSKDDILKPYISDHDF